MSAKEYATGNLLPHGFDCTPQSFLVTLCTAAWWWPVRLPLAER
jgi:hypothetical protein